MERRSRISLDNPALRDRMRTRSFRPHIDTPKRAAGFDIMPQRRQVQTPVKEHAAATLKSQGVHPQKRTARQAVLPKIQTVSKIVSHEQSKVTKRPDLPRQARSSVLKRHTLARSKKLKHYKKHRRPLAPTFMYVMASLLFIAGVFVLFNSIHTDKKVKAQVQELTQQAHDDDDGMNEGLPSEDDPPTNVGSYSVAPDMPRYFIIEKIDVHARVKRVGVSADNVLKAPSNIYDVGWYDGSAKPGENGTVVIDGHVSGPTKHGVFYSIKTLTAGDKVKIERGDGQVFTYTVQKTEVFDYDKVDMAKVLTSSVPGKAALNFMTCTGRFNVRTNQFEQRVVVYTTQDT